MTKKEQKLKMIFDVLRIIETVYLLTFFIIIFANKLPYSVLQSFTQVWITASFMLLPLFLLKNIIVGVMGSDLLDKNQKVLLIVRCAFFILLSIYSYPLISSNGFCF